MNFTETPKTVHGRLLESVHQTGYTAERAAMSLEWLIEEDRWREIGFDNFDDFLETVHLEQYKIAVDRRKKLAKMLTEKGGTQRATAKALGVSQATITNDTKDEQSCSNSTSKASKEPQITEEGKDSEQYYSTSPLQYSGSEIAKAAEDKAKKAEKEERKEERIIKEDEQRKKHIASLKIKKGDFFKVLDDVENIDAIITDPPYPSDYLDQFSKLGMFAKSHLKENGWLACYSGQYNLPEVIKRLSEHLSYVWTFCLYHVGKKQLVNGVNIMCGWKPVLIFSKGKKKMRFSAYDVIISEQMEKASHEWQQSESGVRGLIDIFTEPGQLIVDPFAGAGTFLKVAIDMGRDAIGAEINDA